MDRREQTFCLIETLSCMSALWHDFMKCSVAFQKKLRGSGTDAIRHEWLSMCFFKYFVESCSSKSENNFSESPWSKDLEWLNVLIKLPNTTEIVENFKNTLKDERKLVEKNQCEYISNNSYNDLPPIAKAVAWLIVSHHHLPLKNLNGQAISGKKVDLTWGYVKDNGDINRTWKKNMEKTWEETWEIKEDKTPFSNEEWKNAVAGVAAKIVALLSNESFKNVNAQNPDKLFSNPFILHMSRLVLMLADHMASALETDMPIEKNDEILARFRKNNEKEYGCGLVSHLLRVKELSAEIAAKIASGNFPFDKGIRESVNANSDNSKEKSDNVNANFVDNKKMSNSIDVNLIEKFVWQEASMDKIDRIGKDNLDNNPFFGIVMASTGCGKTLGNARICKKIMGNDARMAVALGLRVLTSQTGQALRELMRNDKVRIIVGNHGASELHEIDINPDTDKKKINLNDIKINLNDIELLNEENESLDFVDKPDQDNKLDDIDKYLFARPKARDILEPSVIACTIDHLMPACDGIRAGRQIVPMLRLLNSFLVLDEPDNFNVDDIYGLHRLVFWTGMLGGRIILSSATLAESFVSAMFWAYVKGRRIYDEAMNGKFSPVLCGWFDEFEQNIEKLEYTGNSQEDLYNKFHNSHCDYVNKRIVNLKVKTARCKAEIAYLDYEDKDAEDKWIEMILSSIVKLHKSNSEDFNGKKVSFGLIRMANIGPLVKTVKKFCHYNFDEKMGYHFHICCYHASFPFSIRSAIETELDSLLNRKSDNMINRNRRIKNLLEKVESKEIEKEGVKSKITANNHLFIIFASPVAETGRDHDYDWTICEPSSMRSLVQITGRIRRHRDVTIQDKDITKPNFPNMLIPDLSWKQLKDMNALFRHPGFEKENYFVMFPPQNRKRSMSALLPLENGKTIKTIDSRYSIIQGTLPGKPTLELCPVKPQNMSMLENSVYADLAHHKYGKYPSLASQYEGEAIFTGYAQLAHPFRKTSNNRTFALVNVKNGKDDDPPVFYAKLGRNKWEEWKNFLVAEKNDPITNPEFVSWLLDKFSLPSGDLSHDLGRIELRKWTQGQWHWHPRLGIYLDEQSSEQNRQNS